MRRILLARSSRPSIFSRRRGGKTSTVGFLFGAIALGRIRNWNDRGRVPAGVGLAYPSRITLLLMGLVVLVYFAIADYLYVARLAVISPLWSGIAVPGRTRGFRGNRSAPIPRPPDSGGIEILEDEPLFSSRPRSLADEDCDEPLMPGFSPGEPLPRR